MPETTPSGDGAESDPISTTVSRTVATLRAAGQRCDSRLVANFFGVGYVLTYLVTVGDISVGGAGSPLTVRMVDDLSLALQGTGFFRFEAIALVTLGPVTYLFSPLNVAVGAVLAALVGANAGVSYLAVVQPRACGLEASSGALASIPALLSGAACCGPTVLLLIGVQASATIVTGFQLLVPVAVIMLIGSLLLVGRTVNPALLPDA